jgi:hypothetical protein
MEKATRSSSFENAMEEVADGSKEGEELSIELEELEGYPFSNEFVAAFLLDAEEADLDSIVREIKMMADEKGVSAQSLFLEILKLAVSMDENKDKNAVADGLVEEKVEDS